MALRASARKILLRLFIGLAVAYLLFAGYILWAMRQPPETFGRVMSKMPDAAYLICRLRPCGLMPGRDDCKEAIPRRISPC